MLDVRCGVADHSFENEFFRFFARELKGYFDGKGYDGILLGMPTCLLMDTLQIDALLITDSIMLIVDFKDYQGTLALPDEDSFYRGAWIMNGDVRVKGGSSPNPYCQLGKQRGRLKKILDTMFRNGTGTFDPSHMKTMVCFSNEVSLENRVPRTYTRTFSIADRTTFLEAVFDAVNVNRQGAGLLESRFVKELSKVFQAEPYDCFISVSTPDVQPSPADSVPAQADQAPASASVTFDLGASVSEAIDAFVKGTGTALILTSGATETRWAAAQAVRDRALDAGYTDVPVLVPTRKIAEHLAAGYPSDGSLYSEIYDFTAKTTTDEGADFVPLRTRDKAVSFDDDASEESRTLLVVCEGHLVSNAAWDDSPITFGSGRLLADTLAYLRDGEQDGWNKVVFIGDAYQLGYGAASQSSLSLDAYPEGTAPQTLALPEPDPSNGAEALCRKIATSIDNKAFSLLTVREGDGVATPPAHEEFALLDKVAQRWQTHRIITYTNAQSHDLNLFVKKAVLRNGPALAAGDILLTSNQFNATPVLPARSFSHVVASGSFLKVLTVDPRPIVVGPFEEGGDTLTLSRFTFSTGSDAGEYRAALILDLLESGEPRLSPGQERLLLVRKGQIEKEYEARHPFAPGNPWFDAMIESGDYQMTAEGRYREKADKRKLTVYERRYRDDVLNALSDGADAEYELITNAVRAQYGWSITAHKAMAYTWDAVVLSANVGDLGRHSEQFFRFLYTGASRANTELSIVRWSDVSPFELARCVADPPNAPSSARPLLFTLSEGTPASEQIEALLRSLPLDGMRVEHAGSSDYQERFRVEAGSASVTLAFSYNKRGEVKSPQRLGGDSDLFARLSEALRQGHAASSRLAAMDRAYAYLQDLLGEGARVRVVRSAAYRDELEVSAADASCAIACSYNAKGLASRIERLSGSRELFATLERCMHTEEADAQ